MKNLRSLIYIILLFVSCEEPSVTPKEVETKSNTKEISEFLFNKTDNPSLDLDVRGIITGNTIKVLIYGAVAINNLIPRITHNAKTIEFATIKDFSKPINYILTAEDGSKATFTVTVETRDLYMCGEELVNGVYTATFWKNGVKSYLGDKVRSSTASKIFLSGDDVYILGDDCYWKNGTKVGLSAPTEFIARPTSIFVSGDEVYICGDIVSSDFKRYNAVYWKNGIQNTIIPLGKLSSSSSAIFVVGSTVYNLANEARDPNLTDRLSFTYYTNNVSVSVLSGAFAAPKSLLVVDGDIHVFGYSNGTPSTWKNGIETKLPEQNFSRTGVFDFFVDKNDVYVCGDALYSTNRSALFWKNGVPNRLTPANFEATSNSIVVMGTDVINAGKIRASGDNQKERATYWIGDRQVIFGSEDSRINDLAVK